MHTDLLRDRFAMAAMTSILSGKDDWDDHSIAALSYAVADAMLQERANSCTCKHRINAPEATVNYTAFDNNHTIMCRIHTGGAEYPDAK